MFKVLLFSFLLTSQVYAFPIHSVETLGLKSLPQNFTADYNFEGIVALNNCSGSLVRFENSVDNDKAMVLTNGHCLETGMPKAGEVIYGQASKRSFRLYDASNHMVNGRLTATQVIYSTMTKTDITLYKLTDSYADIKSKYNVNALTLSSQHPEIGTAVEVISGFWNRGYACNLEAFIPQLKEDQWTMQDSFRYSRPGCNTIGGTSGSPVVLPGTRTIVGVNNTGNESGQKCTMDNPCEVDAAGNIAAVKGYAYGQETYWLYSCLNQSNEVDLQLKGCLLPH